MPKLYLELQQATIDLITKAAAQVGQTPEEYAREIFSIANTMFQEQAAAEGKTPEQLFNEYAKVVKCLLS